MRVALIGDRGIPARYSGFSTLVEELATGLVRDHGFDVTVYCRNHYYEDRAPAYRGVRRVFLPAPGGKSFESIVHSNLAILHAALGGFDAALVVDPGNGPFLLPLRLRGTPTAVHTDGLGWQRRKWSPLQQKYYRWSEKASARLAHWLVTDSRAMQAYYRESYRAESSFIPYSGEVGDPPSDEALARYGLEPRGFYLVVARIEPENNVDLIIREYRAAGLDKPLVVVGGSPYASAYADAVAAENDGKVRCLGGVFESAVLNGLYRHCYAYLHGHQVGGTNPSLLRAMYGGAACIAYDVVFHREVLGDAGLFFPPEPGRLAELFRRIDREPEEMARRGREAQARERALYRWDAVVAGYAELFRALGDRARARTLATTEVYRPETFAATGAEAAPVAGT
jgi:glycosyltransferase involved in cell wall biosynthesis